MTRRRAAAAGLVSAALLLATAATAFAHPLGNFTTNTYAGLRVQPERLVIDYVVDLAEVPAFQAARRVDADRDGAITDAERAGYRDAECAALAAGLDIAAGGRAVPVQVRAATLTFPPGQGGLPTQRLECELVARTGRLAGEQRLTFRDGNLGGRVGWREITAVGDGTVLLAADVPATSSSDRLRAYPSDRLQSPPDQRTAQLTVRPGGAGAPPGRPVAEPGAAGDRLSASFVALVAARDLTVGFGLLAVGLALVLGALHALAPGHGKTVMAAYLVGRQGSARQALALGLTVAVTHTAGVLVLGLLLSASQTVVPERLYPWLGAASGLLFAGVGLLLLRRALRARRGAPGRRGRAHGAAPGRGDAGGPGHAHGPGPADRLGHAHGHDPAGGPGHAHRHDPADTHGHAHGHARPGDVGWRGLIAPGLAGGLVPSPSALVVLLGGIALGRAWFGVALVLAYGLGMAATLVGAGWLLLRARSGLERRAGAAGWARVGALTAGLPVVTAALVIAGGGLIAARALVAV